jgi:tetratricopeptide (TPR) repeat protein
LRCIGGCGSRASARSRSEGQALKARGFEPPIDREEIYAFEDWWKRLQALIIRADTVVFAISPDAVGSDQALREVEYAASLNKRFAPIVCRRAEDSSTPEALRRLNFIFFDDPARFEVSADQLAEALLTDIAWIRMQTEFGKQAQDWVSAGYPSGLLLRSPALEEAERWIASRPHEVPLPTAATQTFIAEGRRMQTRRRQVLAASLLAGLVVALGLAGIAFWEAARADRNFTAAKQAVDGLVFDIAQGLRGVVGMRVDTIRKILGTAQNTTDQLTQTAPNDPQLLRSRVAMFTNFVATYLAAGDVQDAAVAADQSYEINRKLAAKYPDDVQAQRDLSVSLNWLGEVKLQKGDEKGALAAYKERYDIRHRLAAEGQEGTEALRDLSISLDHLGDLELRGDNWKAALGAYQESYDIRTRLAAQAQGDPEAQRDLSTSLYHLGDAKLKGVIERARSPPTGRASASP